MGALNSKSSKDYPLDTPIGAFYETGRRSKGKDRVDNPYFLPAHAQHPQFPQPNIPGYSNGQIAVGFGGMGMPVPVIPGSNYAPQTFSLEGPVIPQSRHHSTRRNRRGRDRYNSDTSSEGDSLLNVPIIPNPVPQPNPLPQPPRDIFETTPWRDVIQNLPQIDEQLLARTGSTARIPPERQQSKAGRSIFGKRNSTNTRNRRDNQQEQSNFNPYPYPIESAGNIPEDNIGILAESATLARAASLASANGLRMFGNTNGAQNAPLESTTEETYGNAPSTSLGRSSTRRDRTTHASTSTVPYVPPPMPLPPPTSSQFQSQPPVNEAPIYFDRFNDYRGFLNHSPHRVRYRDKTYPTATHLSEAIKFLPDFPHIAEAVRTQETVHDAFQYANRFPQQVNSMWPATFLTRMEEVIGLKFEQHADLRVQLLDTGNADLIYADKDEYWGDGENEEGENHLGRLLMRIRERLRTSGYGIVGGGGAP